MNWHNSGNNWNRDSPRSNLFHPVQENIDIVEHLRDNESATGINFLLQMIQQNIWIFLIVTSLRITSNTNIKVITILFSNVLY